MPVEPGTREAPSAIDAAIKQLDALRRSSERRIQALATVRTEVENLAGRELPNIELLRQSLTTLKTQQDDLKTRIAEEQARLADIRRQQAELKEKNEQLRALASLALKHLNDHCPVCEQTYDREATRLRLEEMMRGGQGQSLAEPGLPDRLTALLGQLTSKEKEMAAAEASLRSGEQALAQAQMIEQSINRRLDEFGMKAAENRDAFLDSVGREADKSLASIIGLQRLGESLSLRLSQSSAAAAMNDLRRGAETLRREQDSREKVILARNQTGDLAQRVIEALREASSASCKNGFGKSARCCRAYGRELIPTRRFVSLHSFLRCSGGKGSSRQCSRIRSRRKRVFNLQLCCPVRSLTLLPFQFSWRSISVFLDHL